MTTSSPGPNYQNFVFAGGGSRCFWQAGFWRAAAPELKFAPKTIGAVSAGSAIACMIQMDRIEETIEDFKVATAKNSKNAYPENILFRRPVFPQAAIYRRTLENALTPKNFSKLLEGPEIRILSTKVPRPLGPKSGTLIGLVSYMLEKRVREPVHPILTRTLGFRPDIRSVQSCQSPNDLVELILASSSTPPFTPVAENKGRPILDGGLVDNVPIETVHGSSGDTLVMLTRQYSPESIPAVPGRTYVQPSEPVPVGKWDYTSPEKIQSAFELGLRDGEAFAKKALN